MIKAMRWVFGAALVALFSLPLTVAAQDPAEPEQQLRVFFDCQDGQCFREEPFFRTEITWVDWVRDREDADVHLIITSQVTGSGGTEFQLDFLGRGVIEGIDDRMTYSSLGTDVEEEVLDGLTTTLAIGLARFAAFAGYTRVVAFEILRTGQRDPDARVLAPQDVDDPWNLWVFEVGASGTLRGTDTRDTEYLSGNLGASRTTPTWKWSFFGRWNRQIIETELSDGSTFSSSIIDWRAGSETVYALADRWSVGIITRAMRRPRENQKIRLRATPGIEYSVFPYADATRRALTLQYTIGPVYRNYFETTIFGKNHETLVHQSMQLRYALVQPWGDGAASVTGSHVVDNLDFRNVVLAGDLSLKIIRGLRFNVAGEASWVSDQMYLSAEGQSDAEILLNLARQASDFDWRFNFGFSYRFGSIFNNVVNNRFR